MNATSLEHRLDGTAGGFGAISHSSLDTYVGNMGVLYAFGPSCPFAPLPIGPSSPIQPLPRIGPSIYPTIDINPGSIRIFGERGQPPLVRIDRDPHHGQEPDHMQYGDKENAGRSGNEAYDIIAQLYVNNPNIMFGYEIAQAIAKMQEKKE